MELLLNMLVNLTCIFTGIWLTSRVMKTREDYIIPRKIFVALLSVGQTFFSYFNIPLLNTITMLALIIASTMIVFEFKRVRYLLYDLLIFVSVFAADLIATLCLSVVSNNTIYDTLQTNSLIAARYLLTCIFAFVLSNLAFSFVKKKYIDIRWHEIIIYAVLAMVEAVTASYIERNIQHSSTGLFLIIFLSSCFLFDIYIVLVFDKISKSRKTEKEIALLRQQSNLQFSVYKDLQQRYERSVRIVHDVKKHVNALEGLIENDNVPKAIQYRNTLFNELDKLHPSFKNDNELLSVIVNNSLLKAEQNGITVHIKVDELDLSFISDIDLTTIISNMLDNSIEAVSELSKEKREVWFVIEKRMGCCLFHSENYYDHVSCISSNRYATTKQGHMGVGLTNIETAVKKYSGMFSAAECDDKFVTSVTIPEQ